MKIRKDTIKKLNSARKQWNESNAKEISMANDLIHAYENKISLSSIIDDLREEPDAYSYTLDDLEVFLKEYDLQ